MKRLLSVLVLVLAASWVVADAQVGYGPYIHSAPATGGGGGAAFTNSVRLTNTTAQTITNAGAAALTFDTEDFDNGGMHAGGAPTRITIPTSGGGRYIFTCSVAFAGEVTGLRYVALMLNGTTFKAVQGIPLTASNASAYLSVSTIDAVVATDYMECKVNQGTAGNLDTVAAADYTPIFTAAQIQ